MQIEVVRGVAGMAPHRQSYQELWQSIGQPELLYSHLDYLGILEPRLQRRGPLLFVLVHDGGRLAAAAPLQIIHRTARGLWSRLLTAAGTSDRVFPNVYPSILVSPDHDDGVRMLSEISRSLVRELKREWDEIAWTGSCQQRCIEALGRSFPGLRRRAVSLSYRCSTEEGLEHYKKTHLSKKQRGNTNRGRKQLEQRFDVSFSAEHAISDARWEELAALHSRRQAAKRSAGAEHRFSLFDTTEDKQILRRLTRWAEQEGRLRLFQLRVDDRLASFDLGLHHEGVIQLHLGTFEMDYGKYSPTKLLTLFEIHHEHRTGGARMLDALADANTYKEQMFPHRVQRWDLSVANPASLSGQVKWRYNRLLKRVKEEPERVPGLSRVLATLGKPPS